MIEVRYDFKEFIQNIEEYMENGDLNSSHLKILNKILFKLKNIDVITENIDEDLLIGEIDSDYNGFERYCNLVVSSNIGYINNLSTSVETLYNKIIKYVDFNLLLSNTSNIRKYVKSYKSEITKQSGILESEVNDLLSIIQDKKEEIEQKDSNLNNEISDFNKVLDELSQKQEKLNGSVDTLLDESKEKVNKSIEEEKAKLIELYNNKEQEFKKQFNTLSDDYKLKFENLLKDLNDKDEKISKLIGIVGEKARIGEYNKNANSSRKERIIWQILTVALFVGAFCLMFYVTSKDYNNLTIFRYIVSAILMGAATYTAKQASNSRKDEVYYRKQELELASIDVYLESLEPTSREEIKKNLSTKMFGQAQNTYTNKYDDRKGFSIDDILKIIDSIKNKV